jgi:hypothetical protein
MRKFDGTGYEWRVEAQVDKKEHPLSGRAEFESFWGEEYEWTSMLPTAWKLIDSADLRIKAPELIDPCQPSWWNTPLHLMGLGLGWTDIGKGIEAWERTGFRTEGQPLLNFVYNTWGQTITALGLWLQIYGGEVRKPLVDLRDGNFVSRSSSNVRAKEVEMMRDEVIESMESFGHVGKRLALAEKLIQFEAGQDMFHLGRHFECSVWPMEPEDLISREIEDFLDDDVECYEIYPEEYWLEAHLERYAGFHIQLNAIAAGLTGGPVFNGKESVRVFIKNFGYLGNFTRHPETKRWYLINLSDHELSAAEVHMWGN